MGSLVVGLGHGFFCGRDSQTCLSCHQAELACRDEAEESAEEVRSRENPLLGRRPEEDQVLADHAVLGARGLDTG